MIKGWLGKSDLETKGIKVIYPYRLQKNDWPPQDWPARANGTGGGQKMGKGLV